MHVRRGGKLVLIRDWHAHRRSFFIRLLTPSVVLLSGVLLAQAPSLQPAPESQQPTFRADVDVVTLHVTVLDRRRQPVRGLTAEDFTVLENGEARPIVALDTIEVPTERPAGRPVWQDEAVEDVVTNAPSKGRLVVVMFDRSIPRGWATQRARTIAQQAIDTLGPDDLAAVVYNYHLATPVNFTADRKRLRDAIYSPVIGTQPYEVSIESSSCFCGLCGLDMITQIANALRGVDRRAKMLLYIGEDLPALYIGFTSLTDPCAPYTVPATAALFDAAQRAQLVIHAIDPEGLRAAPGFAASNRGGVEGLGRASVGTINETLRQLAGDTGGRTVLNTNTPEQLVSQVFQESTVSYVIGFTPAAAAGSTDEQRVTVRVRGSEYAVHAPRSYRRALPMTPLPASNTAAAVGPEIAAPPLGRIPTALAGLSPVAEIDLRAAVLTLPEPTTPNLATVATVIGVRDMVATAGGPTTLHVQVTAFDTNGRAHDTAAQTVTLAPQPGATTHTYEVLSRLTLRPGRYEIRAAVEQVEAARVGSVFTSFTVEDFSRPALAVSSLALHAAPAQRLITAAPPDTWLALPPTTERTFTRDHRVTAFLRLLQPRRLAPHNVEVTTRILDARGDTVATIPVRIASADFNVQRMADHRMDVPLAQLAPGDYLLTVDVRHDKAQTTRSVQFSVR